MSGKGSIKIEQSEITLNTLEAILTLSLLKHLPGVVGSHTLRRGLHCKASASIPVQYDNIVQGSKSSMCLERAIEDDDCIENSVGPSDCMNHRGHKRFSVYDAQRNIL